MTDIKKYHVESFIYHLKTIKSERTNKPLSPKTVKHHRDLLRSIFNKTIDLELIEKNPVDGVRIPTVQQTLDGSCYTEEELATMIYMLSQYGIHKYLCFFVLQFYTGARPGELYGLQWKKIDFDKKTILINRSLVKSSNGYNLETTKTEDRRKMELSPYLDMILQELKELEIKKHHTEDISEKFVFTNKHGGYLSESAFRDYLRRFCKRYGLNYKPPYDVRHTTGTVLAEYHVPLPNIAEILGHTNQSTTQKYVHPVLTANEQAKEILTELSTPKLKIVK